MRDRHVRLGLVGAGAIAQSYSQACRRSDLARIVAVADVRADAAGALAEEIGCARFSTHEEPARRAAVDAVLVCTPPATHHDISLHFVGHGVHVLCEKPLCLDAHGARDMVEAAERAGVTLTMASKFRYVGDVIRARSAVASGALGEIILFENTFTSRIDMSRRWNADPRIAGGGVLIDSGTHSVDLMRYILGPIVEVMAIDLRRVQDLEVEDTARLLARSHDGVTGSIDLSWSLHKPIDSYIDIYGSHGTLKVGWRQSRYRRVSSPDWLVFGGGYDKVAAMRRQLDNFCRAIRGVEPLIITAADAIASVEVIQAAYGSLRAGGWTPVHDAGDQKPNLGVA